MSHFNQFIKRIYGSSESVFTCVLGANETGKTDFNLLIMEKLHELGIVANFATNMRSVKADFPIEFINDFETLEQACRMLNPNPSKHGLKKFVFFGSEIGKWAPRDQAWKNVELIEKLQTVRKYGLSMLTDAIDRVDARVLHPRFFRGQFVKPFKHNKKYAIFTDFTTGQRIDLHNIPKTTIQYDTYETANFFMKPQNEDTQNFPLNEEHELAKKYVEHQSWKKAGVPTMKGKRAILKVLEYHFTHCVQKTNKDSPE